MKSIKDTIDLWRLQYFIREHYREDHELHRAVAAHGTPFLICETNGKKYPVVADKGGVFYCVTERSSCVQWVNLKTETTDGSRYYEMLEANVEGWKAFYGKALSFSKPTCEFCKQEFQTIIGMHKHRSKCRERD